jgi:Mrp family chromosome partitioning ATPase
MTAIDRAFIRAYEVDDEDAQAPLAARRASPPRTAEPAGAPHFRVHADPKPAGSSISTPASRTVPAERRPLSTFAQQAPAVEARFHPSLEVDAFRWSAVCDELVNATHRPRWRQAVETLLAADDAGCSLIGVAGAAPNSGATTVIACLARLLAAAGKTVAIVDGDFATAAFGRSLGLGAEIGWEDVLAGRTPLADAVIHSVEDRITVLPLTQGGMPAAEKLDSIHASITAGVLRYHYDIVLFDVGTIATEQVAQRQLATACRLARRCRLDGLLLTTIAGRPSPLNSHRLAQLAPELADICLGVIENHAVGA